MLFPQFFLFLILYVKTVETFKHFHILTWTSYVCIFLSTKPQRVCCCHGICYEILSV